MTRFIYILKCENDTLYVGETKRLNDRMREHVNKTGGITTKNFPCKCVCAVYNIPPKVVNYYHIENQITALLMDHYKDAPKRVLGGKYTRSNKYDQYKRNEHQNDEFKNIHFCKCRLPCQIVECNSGKRAYVCAKKGLINKIRIKVRGVEIPCDTDTCNYNVQAYRRTWNNRWMDLYDCPTYDIE